MLEQAESGAALLAVLDAFAKPISIQSALTKLAKSKSGLDEDAGFEVIDHLVAGRFLQPA